MTRTIIECDKCKARASTFYTEMDPTVNAYEVSTEELEWEGGDSSCPHEDFTILSEHDEDDDETF